ncbi:hypothetical protein [Hungatella hathewayi]
MMASAAGEKEFLKGCNHEKQRRDLSGKSNRKGGGFEIEKQE